MVSELANPGLKEWAVVVRALRDGRQIIDLRKGGRFSAPWYPRGGPPLPRARLALLALRELRAPAATCRPCRARCARREQRRSERPLIEAVAASSERES